MPKFKTASTAEAATIEAETQYDQYDEATLGVPPKGPYRVRIRRIEGTESGESSKEPGTPMVKAMAIISEPKGSRKAKYNNYIMNVYRLATTEQAGRMNQFLQALAGGPGAKASAVMKAFHAGLAVLDDNNMFTKIGTMKIDPDGDGILVGVNTRVTPERGEYGKRLDISGFMAESDMPAAVQADDDEDEEEVDEDGVEVVDDDEPEEEGDELEERRAELEELTLVKLKAEAKESGVSAAVIKQAGRDKDELIESILEVEFPLEDEEEADEEEEEETDPEDERRAELEALSAAKLRAVCKSLGLKLAEYKGKEVDELVDLILENEAEEEEEDEEDEPEEDEEEEAPAPAAKRRTVRKGRKSSEPPF